MLGRIGLAAAVGALGVWGSGAGIASSAARGHRQGTAAKHRSYSGRTSQHQPIAFTIASGKVRKLSFWIVITCKSHRSYRLRASGFAPIVIRSGRFHATVTSAHPRASATVAGRLRSGRVTGTVGVRQYVAAEHRTCAGTATYTAGH